MLKYKINPLVRGIFVVEREHIDMASKTKPPKVITSENRLNDMLTETEAELAKLQPKIEKLEAQLERLKTLKLEKQKLITLRLSIKAILENFHNNPPNVDDILALSAVETPVYTQPGSLPRYGYSAYTAPPSMETRSIPSLKTPTISVANPSPIFIPDAAFAAVAEILKRKQSINYEIYRAVVYKGGRATTEDIRDTLVQNNVPVPGTGALFDTISLSELASRIHYLVRKGVLTVGQRGVYQCVYGWHGLV